MMRGRSTSIVVRLWLVALAVCTVMGLNQPARAALVQATVITKVASPPTATLVSSTFSTVRYSSLAQTQTGTLTLSIEETGPVPTGWTVSISAARPVPLADYQPALPSGLLITSVQSLSADDGTTILADGPQPVTIAQPTSLDTSVTIVTTIKTTQSHTYTVVVAVQLAIPAYARPGGYVSDVTLTVAVNPR